MVFLIFLQYRLIFLLFHFLFCLFGSSLFSSWWAWPEVYRFRSSLQKTSSWFYWFSFYCFFKISILFTSSLIFIISFLLLTLGFVLLFLILLGGRLGCLFDIFLVSGSLWTSLLELLLQHPIGFVNLFSFSFVSRYFLTQSSFSITNP